MIINALIIKLQVNRALNSQDRRKVPATVPIDSDDDFGPVVPATRGRGRGSRGGRGKTAARGRQTGRGRGAKNQLDISTMDVTTPSVTKQRDSSNSSESNDSINVRFICL